MENVQQHTFTLARYTYTALRALRYPSGAPVVRIYSDSEFCSPEVQGPVINFNVLDPDGRVVGYSQVGFLFYPPHLPVHSRVALVWNLAASRNVWSRPLGLGRSRDEAQARRWKPGPFRGCSLQARLLSPPSSLSGQ